MDKSESVNCFNIIYVTTGPCREQEDGRLKRHKSLLTMEKIIFMYVLVHNNTTLISINST